MKKIAIYLISLLSVVVMLGACTHNKVYATVVVTPDKYSKISDDKKLIETTISELKKFNSERPDTEKKIINSLDQLIDQGQKGMSKKDQAEFKDLLGTSSNGVQGMLSRAYKHQLGFDDDLTGHVRHNMLKAMQLMTHSITKNKNDQDKIYKQMLKDTSANSDLYQIGNDQ